ncbi:NAD(+) diphosphatase [Cognatishimia sp.]|uniref:NAD(+) diphosphatase n=1 Tax=Cognatishimia sp. TaxID=2211648 RepID=UPI00351365B8|nr:NAD(+) diphosphatase [Cognatishimia sp.]
MQLFENVTFGPSGLDRVAHLRTKQVLDEVLSGTRPGHTICLWRGKPLMQGEGSRSLLRLPLDHPVLTESSSPILLGQEEQGLCLAHDLSAWSPEQAVDPSFVDLSEQQHPALQEDQVFADLRANMTRLDARDAELASTAKALFEWHRSHRFCAVCGHQSEMSQAGWQRTCPSCGAPHFPRTDPVVIMLITKGDSVLIGRSPGWPEGMYSLLAGFVEPGETPEAAVRREVLEEVGIAVGRVDYLGSQPWAFPNSLMMGFRGEALETDLKIDPNEIEDAIWVPRDEMMQALAGDHAFLKPARKGAIAEFILRHWVADRLER